MALPKRRHSTTRRDKRRANWKLKAPALISCPHCNAPRLPHTACPSCGNYKGELAWAIKKKAAKT